MPLTYSHVVVAEGSRVVFIAGQEPEDAQGNLVGTGDLPPRPGRYSPTSAVLSLPSAPAPSR